MQSETGSSACDTSAVNGVQINEIILHGGEKQAIARSSP